jgi:hypothetical protein
MTTNNRTLFAVVLAAASTFVPVRAHATMAQAATFDEKVENAESIVLGRCLRTESRMDPTGRWILTYSTFKVDQSLKGQPASEVTIVTPGGELNGVHQDTIGIPAFHAGDQNVLFVKNSKVGPTVLYFDQGAYEVKDGVVQPVPSEVVRMDTQRGVAVAPEQARTVRDFQSEVNASIRRVTANRMEMVHRGAAQNSILSVLSRNKLLVAIALLGAALATWQLLRRT